MYERDLNTRIIIRDRWIGIEENPIQGMIKEEEWEELVKQPPTISGKRFLWQCSYQ